MKELHKKLTDIQNELTVNKDLFNSFGKYSYRSCESILEKVKPLCKKHGVSLRITDEIKLIGDRYYVEATAHIANMESGAEIQVKAYAREALEKKGMDESQITGSASSYARKYALSGLFALDDGKDADSDNNTDKPKKPEDKKETEKVNPITEEDKKEMARMEIKIDKLAAYLGCKPSEITHEQVVSAIKTKKESLAKMRETEGTNGQV